MPFSHLVQLWRQLTTRKPLEEPDWLRANRSILSAVNRSSSSEDRITGALIRKLESTDSRAALAAEVDLRAVGAPVIPVLVNALAEASWAVRARIARVIGSLRSTEAIPALLYYSRQAQSEHSDWWSCISTQVESIDDLRELPERLCWELIEEPIYFRIQVVCAFYSTGGPEGIAALCDTLGSGPPDLQRFAALALRALAVEQPCPALRSALSPLRRIVAGWATGDARCRQECQQAIREIERVTVATEQYPVPAAHGETLVDCLPGPHPFPVEERHAASAGSFLPGT